MRLFLASMTPTVLNKYHKIFNTKMNALVSFANRGSGIIKLMGEYRHKMDGFILDSGVWTLNNKSSHNKIMDVPKELIFYYQDVEKYFDFTFNYDSDFSEGGFEINYRNQLEMEKAGLSPVPVVHSFYGKTEIGHYIKRGYKRVALGSFDGRDYDAILYATNRLKDAGIEVHLFKSGSYSMLSRLPVDSADASSWAYHAMCGCVIIWNPKKPGEDKTQLFRMRDYLKKDHQNIPYLNEYENRDEVEELIFNTTGITYEDLMGLDASLYRQVLNCHYYNQIQDIINNKTSI